MTNRFLCKIKRIETDKCSYCNNESESIAHLLFDCEKVKEFWNMLKYSYIIMPILTSS